MLDSYDNYLTQKFLETCRKGTDPVEWKTKIRNRVSKTCNYTTQVLLRMVSVVHLIRTYKVKSFLINDIVAGLTVTFMQLPQGMAYAIVADLPIEIGLFMGFFPSICYFLLGSSRHLSFGAVVVMSMMFGSLMEHRFPSTENVSDLTNQSATFGDNLSANKTVFLSGEMLSREKIMFAAAITITSGFTQIIMGIFRLGFLIKFLSDAIISAFSAGVAFTVAITQLKNILGISIPRYSGVLSLPNTLYAICLNLPNCHYPELLLSIVTVSVLYVVKSQINERFKHRLRMPVPIDFIMVVSITLISYAMQLEENDNFKVVGHIPQGLPTPLIPDISYAKDYISDGIVIGTIAFVYSISVALFVSRKEGYDIDANQELFAYGITNIVAPFFGCFTSAGAVSRTTIQVGCGAKTQVCGLVGAIFMLLVIIVASPLFETLPVCVLSSIIIVSLRPMMKQVMTLPKLWRICKYDGVCGLVGAIFMLLVIIVASPLFETLPVCVLSSIIIVSLRPMMKQVMTLPKLWRICKYDGVIWTVTFVSLIFTSVGTGLLIGVVLGICSVIMRTLRVEAKSLGLISNTNVFLDKDKYQGVILPTGITIISFSSPLYYANVDIFRDEIDRKTEKFKNINRENNHTNDQVVSTSISIIIDPKSTRNVHKEIFHHTVIVECSGITFIDGMGAATLQQLYDDYKEKGISCFFSGVNDRVISILKASGVFTALLHVMYPTTYDAMLATSSDENEISTKF